MNLENLEKTLIDEPKYRISQIKKAVFQKLIESWDEATNLPLSLRQELREKCPLEITAEVFWSKKKDSAKARIILEDGLGIETVLMRHKDGRNTICVSSQVGCPLACVFCQTGKIGFKRNLLAYEIVEQVLFFSRLLRKERERMGNVVFMGMGEPFLNYNNVIEAIRILNDKDGSNTGARHISVSTIGITEGINKLAEEKMQINLAISLHAANNELRSMLMPVNKKYPMKKVFKEVDKYIARTKRQVMFEYLLIKDINDKEEDAVQLAGLMKKPLYFLNLILYNPTGVFVPPLPGQVKRFKEVLKKEGIKFSERYRFGQEIKAACGQLAGGV